MRSVASSDQRQQQKVRVGQHAEKLESIRADLRAYQQPLASSSAAQAGLNTVPGCNAPGQMGNGATPEQQQLMVADRNRQMMINTLTAMGFDQNDAFYALQLVKFSSVTSAAEILTNYQQSRDQQKPFKMAPPTRILPLQASFQSGVPYDYEPSASLASSMLSLQSTPSSLSHASTHSLLVNTPSTASATGVPPAASALNRHAFVSTPSIPAGLGLGRSAMPIGTSTPSVSGLYSSGYNSNLTVTPNSSSHSKGVTGSQQSSANAEERPVSPTPRHTSLTPIAQPELYRSHVNMKIRSHVQADVDQTSVPTANYNSAHPKPSIVTVQRMPPVDSHQLRACSPSACSSTGPATTPARVAIGANFATGGGGHVINVGGEDQGIPVIKARLDRTVSGHHSAKVQINLENYCSDNRRNLRVDLYSQNSTTTSESMYTSAAHPVYSSPPINSGVLSILVEPPEQSAAFVAYQDQMWEKHSKEASSPRRTRKNPQEALNDQPSSSQKRSLSPLPECISKRLKDPPTYERFVQPCKPRMFCFYMEQHVERLVQQQKERMKRARQLAKEMEDAKLSENMKDTMLAFLMQKESRYMRLKRQKLNKDMFELIRHIGVGAFGRVSLVKKKDSGQVYAMKTLLKKDVIVKQQAAHVKAERDILAEADSNWIVKLYFSFQDERTLYFIMEYVPGGDMMQLLINKGFFEERLARFYIAELTCAIAYVHSLGFIHRDIKPDNILIDHQGHIKLTDFGLCTGLRWTHDKRYYGPEIDDDPIASHSRMDSFSLPPGIENKMKVLDIRHKKKRNQAHSVVGTCNYMAPEVLLRTGHTQLCDWWSVGVILYEMVYGRPPFMSEREDPEETRQKILNWRSTLYAPVRCGKLILSESCVALIKELCTDEKNRLGRIQGAKDIRGHAWFRGIDFANLRETRAEWIPRVEHAEDTSNFEPLDHLPDNLSAAFDSLRSPPTNPAFYEFTFRHFFDYDGQGCPSLRVHRRPSLAPLLEAAAGVPTSSAVTATSERSDNGTQANGSLPSRTAPPVNAGGAGSSKIVPPAHITSGIAGGRFHQPFMRTVGRSHSTQPLDVYLQQKHQMHHINEDSDESIVI